MSNDLRLYHSAASPNSRRVRIFLAEKGIAIPLAPVDLAKGEQHSDAYRAINPQRVVPTLVLEDGTAIGEVPAIWRYLEEVYPAQPLLGSTPKDKALVAMWERRAELEGFAAVMEGVRNAAERLKGRARLLDPTIMIKFLRWPSIGMYFRTKRQKPNRRADCPCSATAFPDEANRRATRLRPCDWALAQLPR